MKNKKLIIIISLSFILLILILFELINPNYLKLSSKNRKYISSTKSEISKLNKINDSFSKCIKDKTIDTELSKKTIPTKVKELISIKDNVKKIVPPEEYADTHSDLVKGISSNILVYQQINAILINPSGRDVNKSLNSLKSYFKNCNDYYSSASHTTEVCLSDKCTKYINNCIAYIQQLVRLNNDNEISKSQYSDFVTSFDKITQSFEKVMCNFSPYMDKLNNNDDIDYNNLSKDIDKTRQEYDNIKLSITKVNIPYNAMESYKALMTTFDSFDNYINVFSKAAISKNASYDEILYNYNTMNSNYDNFIKLYTNFKEMNSN